MINEKQKSGMGMEQDRQFESMLAAASERLAGRSAAEIADKAGVQWEDGALRLETLGQKVTVRLPECAVTPALSKWHTLALLHYFDLADGTPLRGEQMTFGTYRDGLVRGGGFDRDTEQLIGTILRRLPREELVRRCRALGAEMVPSNADLCARFRFAPRYPLWMKIWFADEEFPASGRLLADRSAPHYLSIEDAVAVGALILNRLAGTELL